MLKPGYKQTDLGVLPEEWEVTKLGKHVTFRTGPFGSALHKSDYVEGGIPIVNPMQIIDGGIVPTESMAISDEAAIQLSEFLLSSGEIVIGRRGEMGRCAVVKPKNHGWLCGTGSMIIRASQSVDARFLQRVLSSEPIIEAIENASVGTTMVNLNQSLLSNLQIPLPPFVEQHSIADSLDALDTLLASQQQLLTKKRAMKLATQQALLSGERRLPGFGGECKEISIKENCSLKARIGWHGLTTAEYLKEGPYYLVTGTDFIGDKIEWQTCHFVEKDRYDQDPNIQLRVGDVLVTKDGTIGKVAYVDHLSKPATLNSGVFVLRPKGIGYYPLFLFHILRSKVFDDFMEQLVAGSTIVHLYQKDFITFSFLAPSKDEQRAIAAILSDMDVEIEALAAQLAKTQALKQGMMQDLLTGTIRLRAGAGPSSPTPIV